MSQFIFQIKGCSCAIISCLVFWGLPKISCSQSPVLFDLIPDLHGVENQAQGWIVFPDSNYIYMMGDLMDDAATPGDTIIRPFFARFDYRGHMLASKVLYDSLLGGEFRILTRPLIKTDNSLLTYIDRRVPGCCFHACMIELDALDGSIRRYKWYPHPPAQDSTHVGNFFSKYSNGNIVAYHYSGSDAIVHIRLIDTAFTLVKEIKVEKNGRGNFPTYIELINDTTFLLLGISSGDLIGKGSWATSSKFLMKTDSSGNIQSFALAPIPDEQIILLSSPYSFTILQGSNGSWFISGVIIRVLDHLGLYWDAVPIAFSVSPAFDSLNWLNYFGDVLPDERQNFHVASADWASDGSGFVVLARDLLALQRTTYLTKISVEGDKIWTRHYIPTGFDQDELAWSNMEDVKATPYNTFVMAGTFFDRDLYIRRPWLLHVDSMGCLVPGCDQTVSTQPSPNTPLRPFRVAPNPASNYLYLQYQGPDALAGQVQLQLSDIQGQVLRTALLDIDAEAQYIFSMEALPSGTYHVILTSGSNNIHQVETIIKQ